MRTQASAREADRQKIQQAMEQQAADHEAHCQSLSATSEQAVKQLSKDHELHLAQVSAENQAALDEINKMLASSKVVCSSCDPIPYCLTKYSLQVSL